MSLYTCTVNCVFLFICTVDWLCVHFYNYLILSTVVQKTDFIYTCTANWLWHVHFSYESNSSCAKGIVFFCVSMFAQSLHTDFTKFAHSFQFAALKSNLS